MGCRFHILSTLSRSHSTTLGFGMWKTVRFATPTWENQPKRYVDNAPESWEPRTKWEATLKDIMWSYDDQHPRFRHQAWRKVFEKQLSSTPFTIQAADPLFSLPLGEDSVEFSHWLSPEAIWKRFHSLSQIAVLEDDELAVSSQLQHRRAYDPLTLVLLCVLGCERKGFCGDECVRCREKQQWRTAIAWTCSLCMDKFCPRSTDQGGWLGTIFPVPSASQWGSIWRTPRLGGLQSLL